MAFGKFLKHVLNIVGQGRLTLRVQEHGFGGDAFGVDDLVPVKQHFVVFDKAAFVADDCRFIDEMFDADQKLGSACADAVDALVNKQAVLS